MSTRQPPVEVAHEPEGREAKGRPRCEVRHRCILDATFDLLHEVGFGNLTIEGIAERAGVGKTTIYRRWPNKASLVVEAFRTVVAPEVHFPEADTVRESLRQQMRRVVRLMNSPRGQILRSIVAGGQMDPEIAEAFRANWIEARRAEARPIIKRAIQSGELRVDVNPDLLLDALYGPLYFRFLIRHLPLTPHFADAIFAMVMKGAAV